jgi:hypothetical protein
LERCDWCGGILGKDRMGLQNIKGRKLGIFCSDICMDANDSIRLSGPFIFIMTFLGTIIAFINGYFTEGVFIGVVFLPFGICYLRQYFKGRSIASVVPRNSRRNEPVTYDMILQALSFMECSECHSGSLEIVQVEDGNIYQCENCDASGIIEITFVGDKE